MDKATIIRELSKKSGDKAFINRTQLQKGMGIGNELAMKILRPLDYFPTGKEKKYLLADVASRLLEMRVRGD